MQKSKHRRRSANANITNIKEATVHTRYVEDTGKVKCTNVIVISNIRSTLALGVPNY